MNGFSILKRRAATWLQADPNPATHQQIVVRIQPCFFMNAYPNIIHIAWITLPPTSKKLWFNKAKWYVFFKRMVITLLNMTTHKIIICFMRFISFQLSLCINTRSLYEVMRHIFPWNFRKVIDIFNPIISETVWIRMCFFTFERKLFTGS